jgi:hypothetical protein
MDYSQTEYGLAYGLIFGFLLLGMLVVCIPRPRKKGFVDPVEAAKEKRMSQRQKAQAKAKKKSDKLRKKKTALAKKKN